MALHEVPRLDLGQRRLGDLAQARDHPRAPRMEHAAARWIRGAGHLAVEPNTSPLLAVDVRHRREQRLGVRVIGPAEDRLGVADLLDPTEVHDGDPIGEVADHAEIVRDQQITRLALGLELREDVQDRSLDRHVERARRLVGHDDARVARERPGDRDALFQASGELPGLEVEMALRQPQVLGKLVDPIVDSLAAQPGQLADRASEDAAHALASVQSRIGVLEHHLDLALVAARPLRRKRAELVVFERDMATGIRPLDAEDGLGQRRLA